MTPAARVVPDVASFSVDDGFWYSIPAHLSSDIEIGRIVRVPLSGRRVRGWVVDIRDSDKTNLKEIAGVSGVAAVFDSQLLESLRWAARHYVAPLAGLLARATPPNLPRRVGQALDVEASAPGGRHMLEALARRTAAGGNTPVTALVGTWRKMDWIPAVRPVLAARHSVMVVAASAAEVHHVSSAARRQYGDLVVEVSGEDDKTDTTAWEQAQGPSRLVVGTPKTAAWQVSGLGLALVLEESRRAMKDRQTPTIHVRDLLRTRSRVEGFNLAFFGPTPGVELMAAGAEIVRTSNRAWPLVEVVDRSEDEPGSGFLSARTIAALSATAKSGKRAFVFTHRRAGFASTRCARCRALRACPSCQRRVGRVETCPSCSSAVGPCANCGATEFEELGTIPDRLVGELRRRIGAEFSAVYPTEAPISVGTERDLATLEPVDLAVAADVDGMLMGLGYRTSEEALRQLARLASSISSGTGARLMAQTSNPDSDLIVTLRRGDPVPYLERILVDRAREGSPPSSEMIVIEVRGDLADQAASDLADLDPKTAVLGPMVVEEGTRFLLTGDLRKTRQELRKIVGRWRDKGATVRVDADPIDV